MKQITQIEPTGRLESSSQDRLTALQAVTTFGAPAEVFDSEGECPGPQVAGSCPPQAGRCAAMSALMNLMFAPENHSTLAVLLASIEVEANHSRAWNHR